ncbi:hypothetical protein L6452_05123 [Arctium lappa]|uniref:Uncharacterized protein n=1 Tax=Arctium lappa TaxID=4217 RepID=A0ACB9EFI5_ARCLA|nr:hypothetical protein L6452_05123 [Arctium lappa]
MFLWALFVIALTTSYLSFQGFVAFNRRYLQHTTSWSHGGNIGVIEREKKIHSFVQICRSNDLSILVTGTTGFVGIHLSPFQANDYALVSGGGWRLNKLRFFKRRMRRNVVDGIIVYIR